MCSNFQCFPQFCSDKDTLLKVWVKRGMCFEGMQKEENVVLFCVTVRTDISVCVLIMVQTELPLWCFHVSISIQRESGRAATPNRWNKFNDQLKWEPTLSGLRHFNALSSRAWIKVVMTLCRLLLSIKHFAELCSCCDYTSASICDFCSPAGSQEAYVLVYPGAIKLKFVGLIILYFPESFSSHFFQT